MALTKISAAMTAPNTGTGALKIPVGTTAQRVTASAGDMRYNSTLSAFEGYTTEWASLGGIGDEYISATPTLSSSVLNQIVIGNYSSYVSPTFITKIGSTVISNTNNAGTLTLAADRSSFSGTQTVSVEAVAGPTSQPPVYYVWQLFPSLNGGGTKRGSASALSASFNQSGRVVGNLYIGTGSFNWYPYGYTGAAADLWAQYDLGTPQEVLSMQYSQYASGLYYATSLTLQNSNDGTNWVDIKVITQTAPESTTRTINL